MAARRALPRFAVLTRRLSEAERLWAECTMYAERVIPAFSANWLILSSCFSRRDVNADGPVGVRICGNQKRHSAFPCRIFGQGVQR
jgi:hypothetical protein